MRKAFYSFLFVVTLMFVTANVVFAQDALRQDHDTIVRVNPLYADVIHEEDLLQPEESQVRALSDEIIYSNSYGEAGKVLREAMKKRESKVSVYVKSKESVLGNVTDGVLNAALEHTGNPTEGDYIKWQYGGYTSQCGRDMIGDTYYYRINYSITYYTTPEQEMVVLMVGTLLE